MYFRVQHYSARVVEAPTPLFEAIRQNPLCKVIKEDYLAVHSGNGRVYEFSRAESASKDIVIFTSEYMRLGKSDASAIHNIVSEAAAQIGLVLWPTSETELVRATEYEGPPMSVRANFTDIGLVVPNYQSVKRPSPARV